MSSEKNGLLPCPFCGESAFLVTSETVIMAHLGWWTVECGCHAYGPCEGTREKAIAAWNTRAPAMLAARSENNGE